LKPSYLFLSLAFTINALGSVSYAGNYRAVAISASQKIKRLDPEVKRVTTIFGGGAGIKTDCGKTTNHNSEAFYCGSSKNAVIVFSKAALDYIGEQFGNEVIEAVVAHEYGHARQHAVQGFTSPWIWSNSVDEIQADCLAGVYMSKLKPNMSEKKFDEVSNFFKVIGDYVFYEKDWHGSPEMRSASFRFGYRSNSFENCLASDKTNLNNIDQVIQNTPERIDDLLQWGKDILK